jgi:hypothetical protein
MPRFYVTMLWHDQPEGGSYGTVVEAADMGEAEEFVRQKMALSVCEEADQEPTEARIEQVLDDLSGEWIVVDCFDLDAFIREEQNKRHLRPFLDISSAHISQATRDLLEDRSCRQRHPMDAILGCAYGWMIHVPEEIDNEPTDLKRVLLHAKKAGADYVMLDCDGPVIEELPTYEEEGVY